MLCFFANWGMENHEVPLSSKLLLFLTREEFNDVPK